MRIGHVEYSHAGLENSSPHVLDVIGLDLQPHRPRRAQEVARIGDVAIEEDDVKPISQANEISIVLRFCDLSAKYVAVELADAVSILLRNDDRRVIAKNDLC